MILLDSNIIIYSAKKDLSFLRELLKGNNVFASDISRLEVLGFHLITSEQEKYFNSVFSVINIILVSSEIIEEAIKMRKIYNLSVGDSIIAATAKTFDLILYTNNEEDFKNIKEIKIQNPIN